MAASASIPLLRARQARPFIDLLHEVGAPVAKLLESVRLPGRMLDDPDCFVPEYGVWQLNDIAVQRQGIDLFGLRVGQRLQLEALGDFGAALEGCASLNQALRLFCGSTQAESTDSGFQFAAGPRGGWFVRSGPPPFDVGRQQVELYALQLMVAIVRSAAGPAWLPEDVRLEMHELPPGLEPGQLTARRIRPGRGATAIYVPRRLLGLPMRRSRGHGRSSRAQTAPAPDDFSGAVRAVVRSFIGEDLNLDAVAEITRLPRRSLQRQLARQGVSLRALTDEARRDFVLAQLRDTGRTAEDIAALAGYSEPAHLHRAVRRWTGLNSSELR